MTSFIDSLKEGDLIVTNNLSGITLPSSYVFVVAKHSEILNEYIYVFSLYGALHINFSLYGALHINKFPAGNTNFTSINNKRCFTYKVPKIFVKNIKDYKICYKCYNLCQQKCINYNGIDEHKMVTDYYKQFQNK